MIPDNSLRMRSVQAPVVPEIAELIHRHPGTISLGQGVAWYGPPDRAFEAARAHMEHPENQLYTRVEGIQALRDAIRIKLRDDNDIELSDSLGLVVTAGANMGFLNAIMAIADPGDEIILLAPYYFNHEMTVTMLGCRPCVVETDDNYHPVPEAIEAAITAKTRAVVTISPNNPTGAVYSRNQLTAINRLCRERGIYHISDEAYEYFNFTGSPHYSVGSETGAHEHTISLFSLSKSYGFAAWRIGYMVFPRHLAAAILKVQDSNLICAPTVSQYAALGALQTGREYCLSKQRIIADNRAYALSVIENLSPVTGKPGADGAFYLFLGIDSQISDVELSQRLVREHGVAVIPGSPFGISRGCYLRLSYGALPTDKFELAMERLAKGLISVTNAC